tara:strand:+ start:193 stop:462 length:270 start_codon:yes stop_codon:yes gene_type:complete
MIKVKNGNRKGVHNDKKSELINEPLWVVAQHVRNIYQNEENRKDDCQKGEYLIDFILELVYGSKDINPTIMAKYNFPSKSIRDMLNRTK